MQVYFGRPQGLFKEEGVQSTALHTIDKTCLCVGMTKKGFPGHRLPLSPYLMRNESCALIGFPIVLRAPFRPHLPNCYAGAGE
jgi:hypothetical protein